MADSLSGIVGRILDAWIAAYPVVVEDRLVVAVVPLVVGGLLAYLFTERWQRWRQHREFQHKALVKFNELSYDLVDRMASLLDRRAALPPHELKVRRQQFQSKWAAFTAMGSEIMGAFANSAVMQDFLKASEALNELRRLTEEAMPAPVERYGPVRQRFLTYRELVSARMIGEMRLMRKARYKRYLARCEAQAADGIRSPTPASTPPNP